MIGCPVSWKCFVACLFFELSQHPTCPHVRHNRRLTQMSPALAQSSQTVISLGCTSFIWSRCVHSGILESQFFFDENQNDLPARKFWFALKNYHFRDGASGSASLPL